MINQERLSVFCRQFIRYAISGGVAAVAGFLTLFLLTEVIGLWYLASSCSAFVITVVIVFCLQKFWAFKDTRLDVLPRQAILSVMVAVMNLFINSGLMYLLVDFLGWNYLWAQLCVYAFFAVFDYCVYGFVIFRI